MSKLQSGSFEKELSVALSDFHPAAAESLCLRLNKAEGDGYSVSATEEILWLKLSDKIQEYKEGSIQLN